MVNTEMMRQIADRIDTKTRPDDVAGYNQHTLGSVVGQYHAPNECNTTCCIAGHAFVLSEGSENYMKHILGQTDGEVDHVWDCACQALGLTEEQAEALFNPWLYGEDLEEEFGIEMRGLVNDEVKGNEATAAVLRQIANKYDEDSE